MPCTLASHLLPLATELFQSILVFFLHDTNAFFSQCNTSRKMPKFFEERELRVLDWPGNFPGINYTEDLRAIIKRRF